MSLNFNFNFTQPSQNKAKLNPEIIHDFLVIGGGPAGFNATLYAKRKGLVTGMIAKRIGGQLLNTSSVDNYLGIKDISGEGLMEQFLDHIHQLEVPILEEVEVTRVEKVNDLFEITVNNQTVFKSKTAMIATGSNPRKLGVEGEQEYSNRGVAYCAICDAPLFANKEVIIAGGGNSAVEAAIDVAKVASKVTVVHRSEFRADQILLDQMMSNPNITVFKQTQILRIVGDVKMTGIEVLDKSSNETRMINADGIFIEIGNIPSSDLFSDLVQLNEQREIVVDSKNMTSVPGLFAAGDVTQVAYKQIIISVADGAKAALAANEYINHHNTSK
ncbi:MAG TPA: thioredoxin reductase [Erysipelotrichaceae bacterium]|nr:thioredoxin reductase [Erysipelotrichaceae bacterium]